MKRLNNLLGTALLYIGAIVATPLALLKVYVAIILIIDNWSDGVIRRFWQWIEAAQKEKHNHKQ